MQCNTIQSSTDIWVLHVVVLCFNAIVLMCKAVIAIQVVLISWIIQVIMDVPAIYGVFQNVFQNKIYEISYDIEYVVL